MKKSITKILTIFLSMIFIGSVAAGCKDSSKTDSSGGTVIELSDQYIVINGVSPYKIVIPETADSATEFAADEFKALFEEATGANLPIVKDSQVKASDKYFSIGQTKQWEESGITPAESLALSDLAIYTKGTNQYMIGGGQSGTCYAVYEWFERLLDLKYFTNDLHTIEKEDTMKLAILNFIEKPDTAIRFLNYNAYEDIKKVVRLRLNTNYEGIFLYSMGHSFSAIIPPSRYAADHPEWFSPNAETALANGSNGGWQLCTSNLELREEVFRNICQALVSTPNALYATVAQEDGNGACTCSKCTEQLNKYGTYSGVYIDFMNWLEERLTPWVEQNLPERTVDDPVKLLTFCYVFTEKPPYLEDDPSTPEDESAEPTIKANDNVALYFAPVTKNNAYSYNDAENNPGYYKTLQQWKKVTKELNIFNYTHCCFSTLQPYNFWNALQGDIKGMLDVGLQFWYDERESSTKSNLTALGDYVVSQMLWDTDSDINKLVSDFMTAYYGSEAAPYIREYFDTLQVHFLAADPEQGGRAFSWVAQESGSAMSKEYFPFNFVGYCNNLFEEAYAANEKLKGVDPNYEDYAYRIRVEQIVPEYLYMYLWLDQFSYEEASAIIDQFEKYAVPTTTTVGWMTDQGNIANFINDARSKI